MAKEKIPEASIFNVQAGSGVPTPRIRSAGIGLIGVPTARDTRVPNIDTSRKGDRAITKGIGDIARTLGAIDARVHERGRRAGVSSHTPKMQGVLNEWEDEARLRRGSQVEGIAQDLEERYEELKEKALDREGEPFDQLSLADLGERFDQMFTREMTWARSREVNQLDEAERAQKEVVVNTAVEQSLRVDLGDTDSLEGIVSDTLDEIEFIEGSELAPERKQKVQEQIIERVVSTSFDRWLTHDPSGATKLWKGRPGYFKNAMPNNYNAMDKKVESYKKDVVLDDAYRLLLARNGMDFGKSAIEVLDPKFIKEHVGDDPSVVMAIYSRMVANENSANTKRAAAEKQEKSTTLTGIYKKYIDPQTGLFDSVAAIPELIIAVRMGKLSGDEASKIEERWRDLEWTPQDDREMNNWIVAAIEGGFTVTEGDIVSRSSGAAPVSTHSAFAQKMMEQRREGTGNRNYLRSAENEYDAITASKSNQKKEDLLLSKEDFLEILHQHMILEDLTPYSPELREFSKKILEEGVFIKGTGTFEAGGDTDLFRRDTEGLRFQFPEPEPEPQVQVTVVPIAPDTLDPEIRKFMEENDLPFDALTIKEVTELRGGIPRGEPNEDEDVKTATGGSPGEAE